MKVLMLAPLWFPVSRDSCGGIETFLAALIDALAAAGCPAGLVAPGDSRTRARLLPATARNLCDEMERGRAAEHAYYEQQALGLVLEHAGEFDLVHSHLGPSALALSRVSGLRVLHTWHTAVTPDVVWFARGNPDVLISTVSAFQARRLREAGAGACAVIHNGVDVARFPFRAVPGDGLLFLGRIEAAKGVDLAIDTARVLGRRLVLAGPRTDPDFFDVRVAPRLDARVRYAGVADHAAKVALLGEAACVLMPSRVDEACPMVAIEAMACGTPVVGLRRGALPELVEAGVSGAVAEDGAALPHLVDGAIALDRAAIRARAEARFGAAAVAARYLDLYGSMAAPAAGRSPEVRAGGAR